MKAGGLAVAAAAGLVGAALFMQRRQAQAELELEPEAEQAGGVIGGTIFSAVQATMIDTDQEQQARNVRAFLAMIRTAEGTAGPDGYRVLFGHRPSAPRLFDSFADHPHLATQFTDGQGRRLWTTAAGAYQFMAASPLPGGGATRVDTWGDVQRRLDLPDFGPDSQDAAAVELIRQRGALGDVRAGRFADAVAKVRSVWASLPGAGYSQPERSLDTITAAYLSAGGTLA